MLHDHFRPLYYMDYELSNCLNYLGVTVAPAVPVPRSCST